MNKILMVALTAVLAFTAACGDDDDDTADALSAFCDSQEQVLEDLAALDALDPATNTTGEFRSAVADLEGSVDELRAARADLIEQDVANIEAAYEELSSSLSDLDDVVLSEADAAIASTTEAQIAELNELYEAAYASSSCSE